MNWVIFCDLDGVLADFDKGVIQATGYHPSAISNNKMWKVLAKSPNFYGELDWTDDGRQLWDAIKIHNPIILSGMPMGNWAFGQKKYWVSNNLGPTIPSVLGMARDKPLDAMKYLKADNLNGCILIDDRVKAKQGWEEHGGTFVLHTHTKDTLHQLKQLKAI